ncbi:MAG: lysophospholipid acyltransferase family protein [Actinomycetota bacterium]
MSREPGTERPTRHLVGRPARWTARRAARMVPAPLRTPSRPMSIEPAPLPTRGVEMDTEWARRPVARATRRALTETVWSGLVRYYADPEVTGADRLADLDPESGAIFASNHFSHADTTLLLTVIPTPWRHRLFVAAAADYFFPNRVAGFASALGIGAVPIERTRISKRSIELPIELLRDGWSQIIYPEGGRSPDGWGQEFRPGVSLLAKAAGVPIVPTYLVGTDQVLQRGSNRPKRAPTKVVFGRPFRPGDDEDHRAVAARLQAEVAALADEVSSDWWSARKKAARAESTDLAGPPVARWRRNWQLEERRRSTSRPTWPKV